MARIETVLLYINENIGIELSKNDGTITYVDIYGSVIENIDKDNQQRLVDDMEQFVKLYRDYNEQ